MPQKPDSIIRRGDRTDTGDTQAGPDELSSGNVEPTVYSTSFGGESSIAHPASDSFNPEEELRDSDGFETMQPEDGRLGLTNTGKKAADDWAANTGPTRNPGEKRTR